ncbi:MAG: flavin prenyltransferase UbiX [Planctomycetota bacterium]|nr:MAG: flavin prenyltransferase UbiX [Planctomycetota bacterium]
MIYGVRCVQRLAEQGHDVHVLVSPAGEKVLGIEHGLSADPLSWFDEPPRSHVERLSIDDIAARPASGSQVPRAMIVVPCSMGTVGRIAAGLSSNLLERAADVVMKERRPLILVPRETPLSALHLRHLSTLAELGVRIVPAMPAFYTQPASIDDMIAFVVDRALDAADLNVPLRRTWRPDEGEA